MEQTVSETEQNLSNIPNEQTTNDTSCNADPYDAFDQGLFNAFVEQMDQELMNDNMDELMDQTCMENDLMFLQNVGQSLNDECKEMETTECKSTECVHLQRMADVLKRYDSQTKKAPPHDSSSSVDILNDFHHLLRVHSNEFDDIYETLKDKCYDGHNCALSECFIMRRNHR
eukprot:107353_1